MAGHRDLEIQKIAYSDELRKTIKDADIVLFRGRDPLSRVIRRVTRSHYSHAGIVARWGEYVMVLEAKGAGVVASRLSHVVDKYHGRVDLFTAKGDVEPRLNRDEAVHAAKEELGKHYAVGKLFRILRRLYRREMITVTPEKYVCSEYVSRSWRKGGVTLSNVGEDLATPEEIAKSHALHLLGRLVVPGRGEEPVVTVRRLFSGMVCGAKRAGRAKLPATSDTPRSDDAPRGLRP